MLTLSLLADVLPPQPDAPLTLSYLIYSTIAGSLIALATFVSKFLAKRAETERAFRLLTNIWVVIQAVVSHAEAKLRPTMQSVLADGHLSAADIKIIQAEVLRLVKEALAGQLDEIKKVFGLDGQGALDVFLSGLIERAHAWLTGGPPPAPPTPDLTSQALRP